MGQLEWYRRNLQLTPEGVDRYQELVEGEALSSQAASEFAALQLLITLHPLDYVVKKFPKGTKPNFEVLLEKGYAMEVGDKYSYMTLTLGRHDPELLPAFSAYKKLVYEEELTEEELDEALGILRGRAFQESEDMMVGRQQAQVKRRDLARRCPDLAGTMETLDKYFQGPPKHLSEFVEAIGEPSTREEKAIALDTAMHRLHWDPDLLRRLPRREQSVVGSSVLSWLRQLAGDEISDEEV